MIPVSPSTVGRPGTLLDKLELFFEIRLERILMGRPSYRPVPWADAMAEAVRRLGGSPSILGEPALTDIAGAVASRAAAVAQADGTLETYNADTNLAGACYVLCRALVPHCVVETGVAFGVTSAYILQAMAINGEGTLYSIDVPPASMAVERVGSVIPPHLRSRWRLRIGLSEAALPAVLSEAGSVDMFVHDSRHTFRVANWELTTIMPRLAPRAVVLVDDAQKNVAFQRWVRRWSPGYAATVRQQGKRGLFGIGIRTR